MRSYRKSSSSHFNPRSPRGERHYQLTDGERLEISIHAPRVGSDADWSAHEPALRISIHAPRVGSDLAACLSLPLRHRISIHAPRVGSDRNRIDEVRDFKISIHAPRVGSDLMPSARSASCSNFNPRSPRGERPRSCALRRCRRDFNPRSPRGERLLVDGRLFR